MTRKFFSLFLWFLSQNNLGTKSINLCQFSSFCQLFPSEPSLHKYSAQQSEILQHGKATVSKLPNALS